MNSEKLDIWHRHSLIDITAVDGRYGRELCVQCGVIFVGNSYGWDGVNESRRSVCADHRSHRNE